MAGALKLSHTAAFILQAIGSGYGYGFSVIEVTGLASGTVYPAMRRLEKAQLVSSAWEDPKIAEKEQRPPRRYYTITDEGDKLLRMLRSRYPLLERSLPTVAVQHA